VQVITGANIVIWLLVLDQNILVLFLSFLQLLIDLLCFEVVQNTCLLLCSASC